MPHIFPFILLWPSSSYDPFAYTQKWVSHWHCTSVNYTRPKISPVIQYPFQTQAQEIHTCSWIDSIKSHITEHGAVRLEIKNRKKTLDVIFINRFRMLMNPNHCKYFNLQTHTTDKIKQWTHISEHSKQYLYFLLNLNVYFFNQFRKKFLQKFTHFPEEEEICDQMLELVLLNHKLGTQIKVVGRYYLPSSEVYLDSFFL